MPDLFGVLCLLAFGLLLVALIGHGLWLLMAAVFRALGGTPEKSQHQPPQWRPCPACGLPIVLGEPQCSNCAWPRSGLEARSSRGAISLEALAKQVGRLRENGVLGDQACQRLLEAVRAEQRTLRETAQEAAAPPRRDLLPEAAAEAEVVVPPPAPLPLAPAFPEPAVAEAQPAAASPAERVRQYATRRTEQEQIAEPAAPEPPRPPSRPFSQLLAAFMEERNIRWGELVGGLLIVGGSIALVLSFWAQIANRPLLQFFVFNGVTAGLFGLGVYADRRMKLPMTAHGLLIIAALLVPLNFLALAAFSKEAAPLNAWTIGGELASIGLFVYLTLVAGRTLQPGRVLGIEKAWHLVLGVLGPSIAALLIRRFVSPESGPGVLYLLGFVPLGCYLASTAGLLLQGRRAADVDEQAAYETFRWLGMTSFAAVLPLALLVAKTQDIRGTLSELAPLVSLLAAPSLATGLLLWRRVRSPELAGIRTIGTTIAVFGTLVLLSGIGLAWPNPARMLTVAAVDFAVLTAVAILFDIPAAHLIATACFVLAYLVGYHVTTGRVAWTERQPVPMASAMVSAATGVALTPMPVILGLAAVLWLRRGRRLDGLYYAVVAAASAAVGIGLVTWHGFSKADDHGATWVYAIYAAAALVAAMWMRHRYVALAGAGLLLAALVQGLVYRYAGPLELRQPWLLAMLCHASAMAALASVVVSLRETKVGNSLRELPSDSRSESATFAAAALTTSIIAVGFLAWSVGVESFNFVAGHALWLAGCWLVLALLVGSAILFAAFQAALSASLLFAVVGVVRQQPWAADLRLAWLDPWSLQAQGIALALLGLAWTMLRIVVGRFSKPSERAGSALAQADANEVSAGLEIRPTGIRPTFARHAAQLLLRGWPSFDRVVTYVVLSLLVLLSIYAALPGAAQELAPRNLAAKLEGISLDAAAEAGRVVSAVSHFELPGLIHNHAAGLGAWLLLAALLTTLLVGQWERFSAPGLAGAVIALASACPLLAARWEADVAVASALRWYGSGFLLVISAAIWCRRPLAAAAQWIGWPISNARFADQNGGEASSITGLPRGDGQQSGPYTALALFLAIAPLAALVAFVALAAVSQHPVEPATVGLLRTLAVLFAFAAAAAAVLWALAAGWITGINESTAARSWARHAGTLTLILGFAPLLTVVLYVVSAALRGNPLTGPEPGTFFHRIGLAASYALPVALMAATLVGYAVRERSARFAFAAGLLFNVAATAGYLLVGGKAGLTLELWIKLGQINAVVTSGYALAWAGAWRAAGVSRLIASPSHQGADAPRSPGGVPGLLATHAMLGVAFNVILIVPGLWALFVETVPSAEHVVLGGWMGWCALALAIGSVFALAHEGGLRPRAGTACAGLLGLGALTTFTLCRYDTGNWLGYHAMLASLAVGGWLLLGGQWLESRLQPGENKLKLGLQPLGLQPLWPAVVVTLTVIVAVREAGSFVHPWWAVAAIGAMSLLALALACASLRRGFVYVAGALINLGTTIAWLHLWPWPTGDLAELIQFLEANIVAVALPCVAWVVIEVLRIRPALEQLVASGRREPADDPAVRAMLQGDVIRGLTPPARQVALAGFHRVAAVIAIVGCVGVVTVGLLADAAGESLRPYPPLGWLALMSAVIGTAACLWGARAKAPMLGLYVLGLVAVGMTLDHFDLEPKLIAWMGTVVLAAYTIATSYLWSRREALLAWARLLHMPVEKTLMSADHDSPTTTHLPLTTHQSPMPGLWWLIPTTGLLITVVLTSTYAIVLTFDEQPLRLLVGKAAVLQTLAVALLAQGARRSALQKAALCVGVIGAVAWGWAWLEPWSAAKPEASGNLVNRTVVVTVVLGAMTALYGLGLAKLTRRENEWTRAAQHLVPHLGLLGILSVLVVLGIEAGYYVRMAHVPMSPAAIAAVAATLIGLAVAALITALVPGRDPFGLSERGRTIYVYAAEGILALLFLHVRLTMPWLFHGFFTKYWAFIVVFIAFIGVGLSEIFRRQKRTVLAEPLERTGALLPMLPVLGFFLIGRTEGDYSLLLVLVGVLYAALSVSRRSFGFGLLAALAANGGLWYFLHRQDGYAFLAHPQLWLIPAAVCVLAAAYLNREQLSPQQMTTVRYLTSITIYVSSTADIFIHGMAEAPYLPLVLAGLSIAGIFLGIMLRVRAFLFLGTSFLVLALFTIIWHAAVDLRQTWLVWVTVVAAGVLILALFALFEKKRNEVLLVIDKLKHWEP